MAHSIPPGISDERIRDRDELEQIFRDAEKPSGPFRVGAEAEKFGVDARSLAPLPYFGERSVLAVFEQLQQRHGWQPIAESPGGPVIALQRGQASVTLEPGAQLELSGAPHDDVHQVAEELSGHFDELRGISGELGIRWLSLGFHPLASPDELPWVPKERYGIMQRYLPTRGSRGRDMMQRTATVQANFDYESEEDAMRKLSVLLRLAVVLQAICANSPFCEGRVSRRKSERGDVWTNMDPARSGLIPALWATDRPRYRDYVEWALDAGMFFFKRGPELLANTGQTFRNFLEQGFEGHRATRADWFRHLATLFPEVRLKSTLEVRTSDALSGPLTLALPALLTGLVYDAAALSEAEELARGLSLSDVEAIRPELCILGLSARVGRVSVRELAERVLDISARGLARRARFDSSGQHEGKYLQPLANLVSAGRCPADDLVGSLPIGAPVLAEHLASSEVAGG